MATPSVRRVLARIGAALLVMLLIGAFLYVPKWGLSRQKAMVIDGVVENKVILAPRGKYSPTYRYILFIRQKTGEVVRFPVPLKMFEQARVGMPARKRAGEQWPILGASAKKGRTSRRRSRLPSVISRRPVRKIGGPRCGMRLVSSAESRP